jgi:hypothetical protein
MFDVDSGLVSSVTADIIKATFEKAFDGFIKAETWLKGKNKKYDFLGLAARKYAKKMEERYNMIRIFGMDHPVPLRSIYVRVNILENITSRQRLTIADLEREFDRDRRSFGTKRQTRTGEQIVNQLNDFIILGKPGAGKTTFLKYIALSSLDGKFDKKCIPIFISLKDLSDSSKSILDYVAEQFDICQFPEASSFIERVLKKGHCQVLFDGLDEVSKGSEDRILREVRMFCEKYSDNQFIISCRIAAYNHWFDKFTDVEMADFNFEQIRRFIFNWFSNDTSTAELCWRKLKADRQIAELAYTPLLLTLLCLSFDATLSFPRNRSELYKEALDALLKKWDASRRIKRDDVYKHLSLRRKESLFCQIAKDTFEKEEYFLPQKRIEKYIADFIQHLPEARQETLDLDSEAILKAIEAQHGILVERAKGIYSFSHLTFQEYYTAKSIVDSTTRKILSDLVKRNLSNNKWREVFLLIAEMMDKADNFFLLLIEQIKQIAIRDSLIEELAKIDRVVEQQHFPFPASFARGLVLIWGLREESARSNYEKSKSVNETVLLALKLLANMSFAIPREMPYSIGNKERASINELNRVCEYIRTHKEEPVFEHEKIFGFALATLNLRGFQIHHLNFDIYLKANILLIDCLRTECYISKEIREQIVNGLFAVI